MFVLAMFVKKKEIIFINLALKKQTKTHTQRLRELVIGESNNEQNRQTIKMDWSNKLRALVWNLAILRSWFKCFKKVPSDQLAVLFIYLIYIPKKS